MSDTNGMQDILRKTREGDPRQLMSLCEDRLKNDPNHYESNFVMGSLWAERNQHQLAEGYLQKAYNTKPDEPIIILRYGMILHKVQEFAKAKETLMRLCVGDYITPENFAQTRETINAIQYIVDIMIEERLFEEAHQFINQYRAIKPLYSLDITWGRVQFYRGQGREAMEYLRANATNDKDKVFCALWCDEYFMHHEAIEIYNSIDKDSSHYLSAVNNKINQLMTIGDYWQAIKLHEAIMREHPNDLHLQWNYALNKLSAFDFKHFAEYETRWTTPNFVPYLRHYDIPKMQKGEDVRGKKLLVQCEQGIGDQLFFGALLPELQGLGAEIYVSCNERLEGLFRRSFPQFTILRGGGELQEPQICREIGIERVLHLGSIPYYLDLPRPDFVARPFLQADPELTAHIRNELKKHYGDKKILGFTWNSIGNNGSHRSIAPELWLDILRTPGVEWVNLQYGTIFHFMRRFREAGFDRIGRLRALDINFNFEHLTALISALDGVVMIRNLTSYFTNYLGVPGLVLLNRESDFRFGLHGEYSPWFSHLRIIRQKTSGQWGEPLQQAQQIISEFAQKPHSITGQLMF